MQIVMDLPDNVVTEFYNRVPVQDRAKYLSSLLIKSWEQHQVQIEPEAKLKTSTVTSTTMTLREMVSQNTKPTPFTDSISGILKDFDDGRDYKELINEAREARMVRKGLLLDD